MQASPSKARAEALELHSWSIVLSWLSGLYHPSPVPMFERNATTLKALQSLLAENLAADRLGGLLFDAKLEELSLDTEHRPQSNEDGGGDSAPKSLLRMLEDSLPESSRCSLDSLASSVLFSGCYARDRSSSLSILQGLQSDILRLPRQTFDLESQLSAVEALAARLQAQTTRLQQTLPQHSSTHLDADSPPSTPTADSPSSASAPDYARLHAQTLQHQRETKQLVTKLAEYRDRVAALERRAASTSRSPDRVTPSDIARREAVVERKKKRVEELETMIRSFHGLPPDVEASRAEVLRAQRHLETLENRRATLFEEMGI